MTATMPAELRAAFEEYERAIVADDVPVLDASFAPGPATMRGDHTGLLVGHDAISAFRSGRGGVPPRTIERVEYRPLGEGGDVALLVSTSRYRAGGTGLQTQVWQRIDGRWLITAAHVSPRAQPLDRSIWRTVGDPLRPAAAEGPLTGLTVAVKDLFAISGHRIGAGNPTFLDAARVERTTAPAAADLLQGGAAVRGIARTDEFAYSMAGDNPHYGTPPNGALPGALPGGSSSGAASAVATGQADVALATDTAGSIRVPASYQGLWGLRTTHGLVSTHGVLPLAPSFDTVGWIARDGETLQRVVDWSLRGGERERPARDLQDAELPRRFAVPVELLADLDPATLDAFSAFTDALRTLTDSAAHDLSVIDVSLGAPEEFAATFRTLQAAEAWRAHGSWVRRHEGALGAAVAERFRRAAAVTPEEEAEALTVAASLRDRIRRLVLDDVLLLPTVPGPAPSRSAGEFATERTRQATMRLTTPASIAGLPSVTAPLLTVASRLGPAPVGVSLIGRPGSDAALVRLARRLMTSMTQRTEEQ